jgi:hypothetical protein
MSRPIIDCALLVSLLLSLPATAGEATVLAVEATPEAAGSWRFSVTVRHPDTGWDHYADKWQVLGPDGTVLGERVLLHPHVDEQPFTRSLSGVAIPSGVEQVAVRAHDSVDGWGPVVTVVLP